MHRQTDIHLLMPAAASNLPVKNRKGKQTMEKTNNSREPVSCRAAYGASADVCEFASRLDGIEYLEEREKMWEEAALKGYVIIFGYSDDGMEMRGAVDDEAGCWNGQTFFLAEDGSITGEQTANRLDAVWCGTIEGRKAIGAEDGTEDGSATIPWTYIAGFPHARFMMYENGEPYCRGIVFSLEVLK